MCTIFGVFPCRVRTWRFAPDVMTISWYRSYRGFARVLGGINVAVESSGFCSSRSDLLRIFGCWLCGSLRCGWRSPPVFRIDARVSCFVVFPRQLHVILLSHTSENFARFWRTRYCFALLCCVSFSISYGLGRPDPRVLIKRGGAACLFARLRILRTKNSHKEETKVLALCQSELHLFRQWLFSACFVSWSAIVF